jgi:hypothetical protein
MQDAIRENNVELAAVELKEVGAMKLGAAGGLRSFDIGSRDIDANK